MAIFTNEVKLHQRTDEGWGFVRQASADDPTWDKIDRVWIDELMERGSVCITIGDCIYERVKA